MKKLKLLLTFILAGLVAITMNSCKKYESGGLVSKTEKRLTEQTWKLTKYLRNGNDETTTLFITNYEETYSGENGGSYARSYVDENLDINSEIGSWTFDKDMERLIISGVSSLDINDLTGSVSSSYYNILKLDKNEFWYYFDNGGDRHEFRMIKK